MMKVTEQQRMHILKLPRTSRYKNMLRKAGHERHIDLRWRPCSSVSAQCGGGGHVCEAR